MTGLEALQSSTSRDPVRARAFAAKLVPWWGFVTYGVLYAWFVAGPVGLAGLLGAILLLADRATPPKPMSSTTEALVFLVGLIAFVLAWWPFRYWARR